MEPCKRPVTFLIADDDQDDRLLIREAIDEEGECYSLNEVEDGLARVIRSTSTYWYEVATLPPDRDNSGYEHLCG